MEYSEMKKDNVQIEESDEGILVEVGDTAIFLFGAHFKESE